MANHTSSMKTKQIEYKLVFLFIIILFAVFLFLPLGSLLLKSFDTGQGFSIQNYIDILTSSNFLTTLGNSIKVSLLSAVIAVVLAFILSFSLHYTNINEKIKKVIHVVATLPMLLPTITYGFVIIYSFGKQGLITQLLGYQILDIYGFNGILLGYVIYTLPIAFLLIQNAMKYIDKKFITVSKLMSDSSMKTLRTTLLRPLMTTLAAAFIQAFFLSFTDFGIPAAVGGQYQVIASQLYQTMLGSVPDFAHGSVIAILMLVPSLISTWILHYLDKYRVSYSKVSLYEITKNKFRDAFCIVVSSLITITIIVLFAVIVIVPFTSQWPYQTSFTLDHFLSVIHDSSLFGVYRNSLIVALFTALAGTLITYIAGLVSVRSELKNRNKKLVFILSLISNTIPGMVLGIAYLFIFSGSSLQNTFLIMIICNVIHFFSTPYLMIKGTLEKMNHSYETTSKLMGDSWLKTIIRILTPNSLITLLEMFSYYFINGMVTISAIIFITGARNMVITAKIKELQYFSRFNEIFILSLLILVTNLVVKYLTNFYINKKRRIKNEKV